MKYDHLLGNFEVGDHTVRMGRMWIDRCAPACAWPRCPRRAPAAARPGPAPPAAARSARCLPRTATPTCWLCRGLWPCRPAWPRRRDSMVIRSPPFGQFCLHIRGTGYALVDSPRPAVARTGALSKGGATRFRARRKPRPQPSMKSPNSPYPVKTARSADPRRLRLRPAQSAASSSGRDDQQV